MLLIIEVSAEELRSRRTQSAEEVAQHEIEHDRKCGLYVSHDEIVHHLRGESRG